MSTAFDLFVPPLIFLFRLINYSRNSLIIHFSIPQNNSLLFYYSIEQQPIITIDLLLFRMTIEQQIYCYVGQQNNRSIVPFDNRTIDLLFRRTIGHCYIVPQNNRTIALLFRRTIDLLFRRTIDHCYIVPQNNRLLFYCSVEQQTIVILFRRIIEQQIYCSVEQQIYCSVEQQAIVLLFRRMNN